MNYDEMLADVIGTAKQPPASSPCSELHEAARDLASKGFPVFPVAGKSPLTEHGCKDATTDFHAIDSWWTQWPDANIGIATGYAMDCLDVDGPAGLASLDQWEAEHGILPDTYTVRTGGGGLHYYFKPIAGATNRAKMLPGFDYRAKGGYVVAAPSLHASGKRYEVINDAPIAEPPQALVELVKPARAERTQRAESLADPASPEARAYGQAALRGECQKVAQSNMDGGWNDQVNTSAFVLMQLVKGGVLAHDDVQEAIIEAAAPWNDKEVATVESILERAYDDAQPRGVPKRPSYDVEDLIGLCARAESRPDSDDQPSRNHQGDDDDNGLVLVPASAIKLQRPRWLLEGLIPQGEITLLAGREGIGKSTYVYELGAQLTRGDVPGELLGEPRCVIVAASEDSWEFTILPRLMAAGADLDRVFQVKTKKRFGSLSLPDHIADLTGLVKQCSAALLIFDPLLSRLGASLDSHMDAEVRQALEPIVELAHESRCAVVGLIHVNKKQSTDALNTIMASRAFTAVPRSVLYIIQDPEDADVSLLAHAKCNVGPKVKTMQRFSIESTLAGHTEDGPVYIGKIKWLGDAGDRELSDVLGESGATREEREQRAEAVEWLDMYLRDMHGTAPATSVKANAKLADISERTLQRARKELKVIVTRSGYPARSHWVHPDHKQIAAESAATQSAESEPLI